MCGLAAAVGDGIRADVMQACIEGAALRGPDAHGWSTPGRAVERRLGAPDGALGARLAGAPGPAIFHARLATVGTSSLSDLGDAQPLEAGGWRLAHNGVVPPAMWEEWRPRCSTGNDSEAVLRACLTGGWIAALGGVRRFAVIAALPGGYLFACRSWLPLFAGRRDGATYLCSRQLDAWMHQLPERRVIRYHAALDGPVSMGELPAAGDDRWETAGDVDTARWRRVDAGA